VRTNSGADDTFIGSEVSNSTPYVQTLSENRVSDNVGWVHSESVQIPLNGPGQTLSLVGSGRVVHKLHYTHPTRPTDRLRLRTHPRGRCLSVDLSAQSRHVRTVPVGLVWSGRRQSPCVRVVECTGWAKKPGLFFRHDNFVMVSPRKACSMSKFSQFYREKKYKTRISMSLNILCQICSNHHNS